MPIDTAQKRASVGSLNLPFGRFVLPDGSGLDSGGQRSAAAGNVAITWAPPLVGGGGVALPRGRLSAMNLNLPINRSFLPDGSGLDKRAERYLVGLSFMPDAIAPPLTPRLVAAISESAGAFVTGAITRVAQQIKVKPAPKVIGRTFDWDSVVASAERAGGGTPGPRPVAVYSFGSGRNRRSFTELQ